MNRREIVDYLTSKVFQYGNFGKMCFLPNGDISLYNTYNERYWSVEFDNRSGKFKVIIYGDYNKITATFIFSIGTMYGSLYTGNKITLTETTFNSVPDPNAVVFQPDYDKVNELVTTMSSYLIEATSKYSSICLIHHYPTEGINIGDAIQYVSMLNLLKINDINLPIRFIYRNFIKYYSPKDNELLIVNGCMGSDDFAPIISSSDVLFLGLHGVSLKIASWIKCSKHPINVRDEYTKKELKKYSIDSILCGCPSLSFKKYNGVRGGVVCGECIIEGDRIINNHNCCGEYPYRQNIIARKILDSYMTAELVYTKKLHCALPCIAFGTPFISQILPDGRTNLLNTIQKTIKVIYK